MIDFNLLCNILYPAVTVILIGGLITGYPTGQLIVLGVVGYGMIFLLRRIGKKFQSK